jgi:hypothetical protein
MSRTTRLAAALGIGVVVCAATLGAQRFNRGLTRNVKLATIADFDGRYNYCRLMYTSVVREEGGAGWSTDYPDADVNFSIRLSELTKTAVNFHGRQPNHVVVRPTDPMLFQCPWVQVSDAGTIGLSDEEAARLREYLLKGGFMWADDFWGEAAFQQFTGEIARLLPPSEYPVRDLPLSHPLFRTMFQVTKLPQIPSIRFWRPYRQTSERGAESAQVHFRAIADRNGHIMVLMTHNTDIQDAWEREGEDIDFFRSFSPDGYAVGINAMLYAMTH